MSQAIVGPQQTLKQDIDSRFNIDHVIQSNSNLVMVSWQHTIVSLIETVEGSQKVLWQILKLGVLVAAN